MLFPGAHRVEVHVVFAQHGCPGAPQATQVLLWQIWPDAQPPLEQQGCPAPPHGVHVPAWHT